MNDLSSVALQLHERVMESTFDTLTRYLARLHAPQLAERQPPRCYGCDRDGSCDDAQWPCRTYTIIATTVLHISDVEAWLLASQVERRLVKGVL